MTAAASMLGGELPSRWAGLLAGAVLVMLRISSLFVFAPVFSSPAIPLRIKAGLVFAMTVFFAPLAASEPRATDALSVAAILGELAVGLMFGLSLLMLNEAVLFASSILSLQFSFSLVNIVDPVSHVETPVIGQLLGWVSTLVLLGAGLHRTLIAALLRSFLVVPLGCFRLGAHTGPELAHMAGGLFLAGVQLASPVLAAALTVEVTVALIGRLSPQLPSSIVSIPLKTLVSYVALIGSLAVWPRFFESHFTALLDGAGRLLTAA